MNLGGLYDKQYTGLEHYRQNSLEQALDALEEGRIEALASDGIILRSFLNEGIPEGNIDQRNTILFRKSRDPYESLGFSIFPEEGSLPGLAGEQYGVAVLRDEDANSFQREVNTVLSQLNEPGSRLAMARENIRAYESGLSLSQKEDNVPNSGENDPDPDPNPNFWIIVATVLLFLTVCAALLGRKFSPHFLQKTSASRHTASIDEGFTRKTGESRNHINPEPDSSFTGSSSRLIVEFERRKRLYKTLLRLPRAQFNAIIFCLEVPSGNIPSSSSSQADRVMALLEWAKSPVGCGLEHVEKIVESVISSNPQ